MKYEDNYKSEAERSLEAQIRIFKHGYIPLVCIPGVTVEDLEKFADKLDARNTDTDL